MSTKTKLMILLAIVVVLLGVGLLATMSVEASGLGAAISWPDLTGDLCSSSCSGSG